jgi:fatty acid desaturase
LGSSSPSGAWRWVYAAGAVFSFYLNFFVLVAQAFAKIPALKALAPTQSEPPFAIAQGVVLIAFAVVGVMAIIRFRPSA